MKGVKYSFASVSFNEVRKSCTKDFLYRISKFLFHFVLDDIMKLSNISNCNMFLNFQYFVNSKSKLDYDGAGEKHTINFGHFPFSNQAELESIKIRDIKALKDVCTVSIDKLLFYYLIYL